jgi:membrane-associated protein
MNAQLLDILLTYGVVALAPILAASALGLPLPASLLLLAGGAFAGSGQLDLLPLIVVGIIATSAGDSLGYWLGRRGGGAALGRLGPRLGIKPTALDQADAFLGRWGGVAILLTRFLITPLGPVINIVAGTGRYPYRRFIAYDALGEAIWVLLYLALGYLFSASWDVLADILGQASQALAVAAVALVLLVLLVRTLWQRQARAHAAPVVTPLALEEPEGTD